MKKHAAQYHDEERITSVPDSLGRPPRQSQQDRSLFTLKSSYSKNENRRIKSTPDMPLSIVEDGKDAWISNEIVSRKASLQSSQDNYPATAYQSVTNVGDGLAELRLEDLSLDHKQEHDDWYVVYNPRLERNVSLELVFEPDDFCNISSLRFSPNKKLIAIASLNETSIFDISSRMKVASLDCDSFVDNVQFSPDGKFLAFYYFNSLFGVRHTRFYASSVTLTVVTVMEHCGEKDRNPIYTLSILYLCHNVFT